jgi:hypothetical protein
MISFICSSMSVHVTSQGQPKQMTRCSFFADVNSFLFFFHKRVDFNHERSMHTVLYVAGLLPACLPACLPAFIFMDIIFVSTMRLKNNCSEHVFVKKPSKHKQLFSRADTVLTGRMEASISI